MNVLDRVITWFAPQWGQARARARFAARHFEAASVGRRTDGWHRLATDANAAAGGIALSALRAQARDLVRNNPWARHGLRRLVANTVGWGIRPKAMGPGAELVMQRWRDWAETTQCDAAGRLNMYGLQKLVMRTIVESGEVIIRRRWRLPADKLAVPMQLQVLEPDFLDTGRDGYLGEAGGPIVQGVEFDLIGRRAAYWLFDRHPGSTGPTGSGGRMSPISRRVPAEGILHVFDQERPGQVRGPSWFAPVDVLLHDLGEFQDATVVKQKIAACLAAFVTDLDGTGTALGQPGTDSVSSQPTDTFEPGMIVPLTPGKQVQFANPPQANDYQQFSSSALHGVAAGLGVTYEDLCGDYCIAPETRVLRADLRWVRADELLEGAEIIAFDEHAPGGKGGRRKWRKASVVRAGRRTLNRRKIATDGAIVTVSDEHLFLCTQRGPSGHARGSGLQARSENPIDPGCGQRWVRADRIQVGDQIVFLCAPWSDGASREHGYMKGISDGEGYVDKHDAKIGIAQNPGLVFDEIGEVLASLGIPASARNANGIGKVKQWQIMGIADCLRFLGEVRPTRLMQYAERVYNGKMLSGGAKKSGRPTAVTVLSVEDAGQGPVVTLETSTRTLITEGLCSHNSQVNYSSGRLGRLGHQQDVQDWQWNMLIPMFCAPVWEWMVAAIVLEGEDVTASAEWHPAPMPLLDPDKEGKANQLLVRTGQKTWPQMIREQGEDPDRKLEEIAAFNAQLDKLGISLDCDPRKLTAAGQNQPAPAGGAATMPKYPVGSRVVATANHTPGMSGMAGTVAIANAGAPPYYGVSFDDQAAMPGVHKWLSEDEVKAEGTGATDGAVDGGGMDGATDGNMDESSDMADV